MIERLPVVLSWSGGKDSSLALSALRADTRYEVMALMTTITRDYDRISIHGVRRSLLERQAEISGLPLRTVSIPASCSNEDYEAAFLAGLAGIQKEFPELTHVAFGDLFLSEIREYRERLLEGTSWSALFPLWNLDTAELALRFIAEGYESTLVCVDTTQLAREFAGRKFDAQLLADLPATVDSCGERGEFHTFVSAGPCFDGRVECEPGEIVMRDERFAYCDLMPAES